MNKVAFLFPGQGVQMCGMGKDFYEQSEIARNIFEEASSALHLDMKALCFEENCQLDKTEYTQAALVTTCLAMARTLMSYGIQADFTAGLSLGEYCAIAIAGGMNDLDAIQTVRARGKLMQDAVPDGEGSMSAIFGMDKTQMEQLLSTIPNVFIANYNCPGQIVITGATKDIHAANELLLEHGAKRAVLLNVSGPFHSPFLKEAGNKLESVLEPIFLSPLSIPYVTNVNAQIVTDIRRTKELLKAQVSSPVCWQQSMEVLLENGVDTFIEIGPGKTLSSFLRKIDRSITVYHVGTWEEMHQTIQQWEGV